MNLRGYSKNPSHQRNSERFLDPFDFAQGKTSAPNENVGREIKRDSQAQRLRGQAHRCVRSSSQLVVVIPVVSVVVASASDYETTRVSRFVSIIRIRITVRIVVAGVRRVIRAVRRGIISTVICAVITRICTSARKDCYGTGTQQ
jgi:hypothetical protein